MPTAALNSPVSSAAITLHISPRGGDAAPGSAAQPLATLRGARDRLRELRRAGQLAGGATVLIHAGDYAMDESLELGPEDSGVSPTRPIVYAAAPGEKVRLLGGKVIRGWRAVSDPMVAARFDPIARPHIVEADLRANGVARAAPLQSRGFGRGSVPSHSEVFFNNLPMTVARWPNAGDASASVHGVAGWTAIASFPGGGENDGHGQFMGTLDKGFFYETDRPDRWANTDDVWIHGYWAYDWANSYERVATLDKQRKFIRTFQPHGLYGFARGQKFHFLNVLEELDTPGEYFVDRERGVIYFYPPSPVERGEAILSTLGSPVIEMRGASNVVLRGPGLSIECTRGHGVLIEGGDRCLVAGVTIRNAGAYGVFVLNGANHGVQSCDISHTGDGGVALHGGDRKTLTPASHFVDNCHFHHQARWSRCYHPCVHMTGVGARVTRNVMHDHPHCPVLFNGNEHLIEGNEIYSACWETGDVGGIYMGRDYTERGNVIRYNFLHHLGGIGLGSFAVYLDDCASGAAVVGNIFHRTNMAVLIGGGRDHLVEDNVVVESSIGVHLDGRGVVEGPVWRNMVNVTMKERLNDMKHHQPPYSVRYPELAALEPYYKVGNGVPGENNRLVHNVCTGGQWLVIAWGAKPEWVTQDGNYLGSDPGFVDAAHPELAMFALRRDGAAAKLGHRPTPIDRIGLYADEYRKAWPRVVTLVSFAPDKPVPGKVPAGVLNVRCVNQGTADWSGEIEIVVSPRGAVRFEGGHSLAMTIPAGGTAERAVRIECPASAVELSLASPNPGLRPARLKLRFAVATAKLPAITRVADVAKALDEQSARPVSAGGAALGEVRFAVAGDKLALAGRVIDTAVTRRDESPWEGSCIELFGSTDEGTSTSGSPPRIGQVYLLPADKGARPEGLGVKSADAAAIEQSGKRVTTDRIQVTTRRTSDGYEFAALVPLEFLAVTPGAGKFLLEVIFNSAATPGAGAKRSTLFGSTAAFNNTSRYGRVELV